MCEHINVKPYNVKIHLLFNVKICTLKCDLIENKEIM